jgi:hypothetical protein
MAFDTRTLFDLTHTEVFVRYRNRLLITLSILILPLLLSGILLKPSIQLVLLLIFTVVAIALIAIFGRKRVGHIDQLKLNLKTINIEKEIETLNARLTTIEDILRGLSSDFHAIKSQIGENLSYDDKEILTLELEGIGSDEIDSINIDLINRTSESTPDRPAHTTLKAKRVAATTFTIVNRRNR